MKVDVVVKYRVQCSKVDPRNTCKDYSRKMGFYWTDISADLPKDLKQSIRDIREYLEEKIFQDPREEAILDLIQNIEAPKMKYHVEAIRILVGKYIKGGCNGTERLNCTYEFFKDMYNETYIQKEGI
jgi:hypothetical protein